MWLSDLRLILPDQVIERGSIRIEDGLIAEIVAGPAPWTDLSLLGLTAMPGIVDMHGDMLEREIRPRPKAEFPLELAIVELDKRLASSGVTTAFAAISFNWQTDNDLRTEKRAREIITTLNRMRSKLLVDHYVHVRFEITNPQAGPLLDELLQAGLVHLVCLNDHTPGQGQ
ncbi:MAG TPA: alpha-D-ribose 1-methylphosphonate 5-triphosphate diphosphatase, partial [Anaerolineae bacterium]|nr:alpha-D-ribose 1-methylphosphonate 5-triphosphate diphosphatase [Anaerolineae bacterium]